VDTLEIQIDLRESVRRATNVELAERCVIEFLEASPEGSSCCDGIITTAGGVVVCVETGVVNDSERRAAPAAAELFLGSSVDQS
jgi:hypothetical protein